LIKNKKSVEKIEGIEYATSGIPPVRFVRSIILFATRSYELYNKRILNNDLS